MKYLARAVLEDRHVDVVLGLGDADVLYEKGTKSNLSGNEVYQTYSVIPLVNKMLCTKPYCRFV